MDEQTDQCCPPPDGALDIEAEGEPDQQLARLADALGHPTRVAIVRTLIEREECVCGDLVDELPYAQSTVSGHLKKLKEAGLVRGEVDGPSVCYCIEPRGLTLFKRLVEDL
jgi:ArsR family transcriptional regulator